MPKASLRSFGAEVRGMKPPVGCKGMTTDQTENSMHETHSREVVENE